MLVRWEKDVRPKDSVEEVDEANVSDFDIRGDWVSLGSFHSYISLHADKKLINEEELMPSDFSENPQQLEYTYDLWDEINPSQSEIVENGKASFETELPKVAVEENEPLVDFGGGRLKKKT